MINIESVSKTFPGKNGSKIVSALDDISMNITTGEFVMIIGASGSGKSTLLFTIGAMMKPTAGEIRLNDIDLYSLSVQRRAELRKKQLGFVFQTFNLLPYLNCRDNVALPAALAGASRRDAYAHAESLLARVGLSNRLFHRPSELSVGERQRVALCRSIINEPEILLADEPTGNLDPSMTEQVMNLLLELNQQGQTILVVSHNQNLVELGTRVVRLRQGKIDDDRPATGRKLES